MVLGIQILIKDALKAGDDTPPGNYAVRTSGASADWLLRTLKTDRGRVEERCRFAFCSKFLPSCPTRRESLLLDGCLTPQSTSYA